MVLSQLSENTKSFAELRKSVDRMNEKTALLQSEIVHISVMLKEVSQIKDRLQGLNSSLTLAEAKIVSIAGKSDDIEDLKTKFADMNREIGEIQIKSGIFGALSGVIASIAFFLTRAR
jgi:predicted RNase H-like nuclease (RuvC/YqgF family)